MTEKQALYSDFLLRQLGFFDKDKRTEYFNELTDAQVYEYDLRDCTSNAISELITEVNLRTNRRNILRYKRRSKYISASDIASFAFCPVSFTISNSFRTKQTKKEEIGTNFHKQKLLGRVTAKPIHGEEKRASPHLLSSNRFYKQILNSNLIFQGHSDYESKKVFHNKQEQFSGQPDYIFKNRNGIYFIVEEKFRFYKVHRFWDISDEGRIEYLNDELQRSKEIKPPNYLSNKLQLYSYFRNNKEHNTKYGYLVYWFYDYKHKEDTEPAVHTIRIIKMNKSYNMENKYIKVKNAIKQLLQTGQFIYNPHKISYRKCANCSVRNYCHHKTKQNSLIKYPYNPYDLKVFAVKYYK